MRFKPMTEEELNALRLIPEGEYNATIAEVEEGQSKGGNEMLTIKLRCYRDDNSVVLLTDYLVNTERMLFKLRHLCECAGILDIYERGELTPSDLEGKHVKVMVKVDPAKDGYDAKNSVKDYVVARKEKAKQANLIPGTDTKQMRDANRKLQEASGGEDIPF